MQNIYHGNCHWMWIELTDFWSTESKKYEKEEEEEAPKTMSNVVALSARAGRHRQMEIHLINPRNKIFLSISIYLPPTLLFVNPNQSLWTTIDEEEDVHVCSGTQTEYPFPWQSVIKSAAITRQILLFLIEYLFSLLLFGGCFISKERRGT